MLIQPIGSREVRPNTLHDQTAPNTLHGVGAPRRRAPARSGSRSRPPAARTRGARVVVPLWAYLAGILLILLLAYLLQGAPAR